MNLIPVEVGNALRSELPDGPGGHLCPLQLRPAARGLDRGPGRGLPALCRAAGLAGRRGLRRPGAQRRQPLPARAIRSCCAMPSAAGSTSWWSRRSTGWAASWPTSPPCTTAGVPRRRLHAVHGRGDAAARRHARHHGAALPVGPAPTRPGAASSAGCCKGRIAGGNAYGYDVAAADADGAGRARGSTPPRPRWCGGSSAVSPPA